MTTDDREPETAESVETEAPPMIYFTIMSWGRRTSKGEGGSKSLGVLDVDRGGAFSYRAQVSGGLFFWAGTERNCG